MNIKYLLSAFVFFAAFNGCMNRTIIPESPHEVIDGVKMPRVKSAGDLEYPEYAKRLGLQGRILVKVFINKQGKVTHHEIVERKFNYTYIQQTDGSLKPVSEVFDPLAAKFIQAMIFEPAIKNGAPIDISVFQPVSWKLED